MPALLLCYTFTELFLQGNVTVAAVSLAISTGIAAGVSITKKNKKPVNQHRKVERKIIGDIFLEISVLSYVPR